ncbi:hypothetical protein GW17_00060130 [Ensete ventricosum]|nr:hypothetical protein GW17_00060130 [Ensete ventricosum]
MNAIRIFPKRSHIASSGSRNDTLLISSLEMVRRDHFYFSGPSFESSDFTSLSFSLLPLQSSLAPQVGMASSPSFSISSFYAKPSSPISPPRAEECCPSDSSGNKSGPPSSSSSIVTRADAKALQALEAMKSFHDFDSIVTYESLASIRKCYSISDEFTLHALGPWQRPYHPYPSFGGRHVYLVIRGSDGSGDEGPGADGGRALETDSAMDALQVDLPKKAIEEDKKSLIFDMELYRMGWVSLEYGYQLALARLRAQHPGIEKKEDPLTLLLENVDVSMTKEQPFDDSPPSADG